MEMIYSPSDLCVGPMIKKSLVDSLSPPGPALMVDGKKMMSRRMQVETVLS